jgi:hypothetical protein
MTTKIAATIPVSLKTPGPASVAAFGNGSDTVQNRSQRHSASLRYVVPAALKHSPNFRLALVRAAPASFGS